MLDLASALTNALLLVRIRIQRMVRRPTMLDILPPHFLIGGSNEMTPPSVLQCEVPTRSFVMVKRKRERSLDHIRGVQGMVWYIQYLCSVAFPVRHNAGTLAISSDRFCEGAEEGRVPNMVQSSAAGSSTRLASR